MRRRGFEISFNFILAIIIIAFIIAAAGYAISYFLDLKQCTDVGLFTQDLQREIDKNWNSEIARQTFTGSAPSGITSVCVGNVSRGSTLAEYTVLKRYARRDANLFFYPPEKACDAAAIKLEHLTSDASFTCFDVVRGKVSFTIEKNSAAALVSIS